MHTIHIHIDETLDSNSLRKLESELRARPEVRDVVVDGRAPHDMVVDYEQSGDTVMDILGCLQKEGVHTDVTPC